jgi:hypothetical protein
MAYTAKVGGMHVLEDGKAWAEGGVIATYYDLEYKHVQALWEVMSDPSVAKAYQDFTVTFINKVCEVGNRYAMSKGKLTKEDV